MPQKGTVPRVCAWCGAAFFTFAAWVRRGRGRYCSRRCLGAAVCSRRPRGPESPNWVGDAITRWSGYARSQRQYALGRCALCEGAARYRHHWDKNPRNNAPENIALLCPSCHGTVHAHAYV